MFKVSIRVIILTLFILLLVTAGGLVISNGYSSGYSVLREITVVVVRKSAELLAANVLEEVRSLQQQEVFIADLIKNQIITPGNNPKFSNFLLKTIAVTPNISALAYITPSGNYYELTKAEANRFNREWLKCSDKICILTQTQFDRVGKQTTTPKITSWKKNSLKKIRGPAKPYNPLAKPWYLQAYKAKGQSTPAILSSGQNSDGTSFSANMVYPLYQDTGTFFGVLAFQVKLINFANILTQHIVTTNSFVYLFDDRNNLIATNITKDSSTKKLVNVSEIELPWVQISLQKFRQTHAPFFYFKHVGVDYLAVYDRLIGLPNSNWTIGVVVPFSDVLKTVSLFLFSRVIIVICILLFCLGLAWLFANAITKPILSIIKDAEAIGRLDLTAEDTISKYSSIKEISCMQNAFQSMRLSLKSFTRYLPFAVVKQLVESGEAAHVGGEKREMTFLFVDIAGFTALSEKMAPDVLMDFLSQFFEAMSRIIIVNHGTIDKYIGDAIMAFWGAPTIDHNHTINACNCALAMHSTLIQLNQKWSAQNMPQLKFRIGINSGEAIVGNVGSEDHLSYSAIGDTVNVAKRIEEINKAYKTEILISHTVYQLIAGKFTCRLIDNIRVRGKKEVIGIYELLSHAEPQCQPDPSQKSNTCLLE